MPISEWRVCSLFAVIFVRLAFVWFLVVVVVPVAHASLLVFTACLAVSLAIAENPYLFALPANFFRVTH